MFWTETTHLKNDFSYNYWDDWTNPDNNSDGFVDSTYSIDGDANNHDAYPRAEISPSTLTTTNTTSDIQTGTLSSSMIPITEQDVVESFEEMIQIVITMLLLTIVSCAGVILGKRITMPYIRRKLKKRKEKQTPETLRLLIDMTDV